MSAPLLQVSGIETYYGPIQAIRGVSIDVPEGKIVTVLGANGAGKTTILRTISGVLDADRGEITFQGQSIAGQTPDRVMRAGICHSPEGREIFPFLSVAENLVMGSYTRRDKDGVAQDLEMCFGYFPRLKERAQQRAGQLSGGEQQMLAMSRALSAQPDVLLLDEISMGLAPLVAAELFALVRVLADDGIPVLLVEQFARSALEIADTVAVLAQGRIRLTGAPADVRDRVLDTYLHADSVSSP